MNDTVLKPYPDTDTLTLTRAEGWLTVWLNRPEHRNAMSRRMTAELTQVLEAAGQDDSLRGLVLRGRNGVFCAGGDLAEFRADFQSGAPDRADIITASEAAGRLFHTLNTLPKVTVALVEGAAMAGGLGLMCACDVAIATQDARFAMTETTLGIPPAQIAPYVRARTGPAIARQLMLTAARLTAPQAQSLGLLSKVVSDAAALDAENAVLRDQLRRCAPGAVAATKALLLEDGKGGIAQAAGVFADCILSDEGHEGIAAFFEKRPPRWAEKPDTKAPQ